MPELGRLAVCLALISGVCSIAASIRGGITRRPDVIRVGEHAAFAVFGLVLLAVVILLRSLLTHDFSLEYAAACSPSTLLATHVPPPLRVGQARPLLLCR